MLDVKHSSPVLLNPRLWFGFALIQSDNPSSPASKALVALIKNLTHDSEIRLLRSWRSVADRLTPRDESPQPHSVDNIHPVITQ